MHRLRRARPGFTLLEVVLATAIAALLLGAVYVSVDMLLGYSQMSRDIVEESTLSRALFARMDSDASQVVGLSDMARYRFQGGLDTPDVTTSSSAPMANATPNNASNTTSNNASNTTSSNATTSTSPSFSGQTAGPSSFGDTSAIQNSIGGMNIVLPLGVEGDSESLHLFVSTLPRELYSSGYTLADINSGAYTPPVVGDVRRVSYWLAGGDGAPVGLARQDVPLTTGDDALQNVPPGLDNESTYIIADEVRSLSFQYYDGEQWWPTWDSTQPGPDGVTPIGSPLAISVTIGVAPPHTGTAQPTSDQLKTYTHVLLIPSANGATMLSQASTGTGSTTTSSTNSTNSNGSGSTP